MEQQNSFALSDDLNTTSYYPSSALLTHAPQSSVGWQPENSSTVGFNMIRSVRCNLTKPEYEDPSLSPER